MVILAVYLLNWDVIPNYNMLIILILAKLQIIQQNRNKSFSNLNQLQSARMGIFGWKGRFSDIGEFS